MEVVRPTVTMHTKHKINFNNVKRMNITTFVRLDSTKLYFLEVIYTDKTDEKYRSTSRKEFDRIFDEFYNIVEDDNLVRFETCEGETNLLNFKKIERMYTDTVTVRRFEYDLRYLLNVIKKNSMIEYYYFETSDIPDQIEKKFNDYNK